MDFVEFDSIGSVISFRSADEDFDGVVEFEEVVEEGCSRGGDSPSSSEDEVEVVEGLRLIIFVEDVFFSVGIISPDEELVGIFRSDSTPAFTASLICLEIISPELLGHWIVELVIICDSFAFSSEIECFAGADFLIWSLSLVFVVIGSVSVSLCNLVAMVVSLVVVVVGDSALVGWEASSVNCNLKGREENAISYVARGE